MADVPGVPALFDPGDAPAALPALLFSDALNLFSSSLAPQWGIFQGGAPIVTADSVASFDYKKDWTIGNYPVERGAFASYDKVEMPFDVRFRFATGGSAGDRAALLSSIAAVAGTTDLYDAVTPEQTFSNISIRHYDYKRTAMNGVGLLVIDVWAEEIRQAASTGMDSTQQPSGADAVNGGTVQPTAPTSSQAGDLPSVT